MDRKCVVMLAVVCGSCGCGQKSKGPEELIQERNTAMAEVAGVFESIKDDASADAAIAKIDAATKKIEKLAHKINGYKLTLDERMQVEKKFKTEYDGAHKRLTEAIRNALAKGSDASHKKVSDAYQRLRQALNE